MRSSVVSTISSGSGSPVLRCCRSRNSYVMGCGNLGWRPKPPFLPSNCAARCANARFITSVVSGSTPRIPDDAWRMCARSCSVVCTICDRLFLYAEAMASSTLGNAGRPPLSSGGKYVPP